MVYIIRLLFFFHPETLNSVSPLEQVEEILEAIESYIKIYKFIFIGSNADTYADLITCRVKEFCNAHINCFFLY